MNPFSTQPHCLPNYLHCEVSGPDEAIVIVREITSSCRDNFPYLPRGIGNITRGVSLHFQVPSTGRQVAPVGYVNFRYLWKKGVLEITVDNSSKPYERKKPLEMLEILARHLLETQKNVLDVKPDFGLKKSIGMKTKVQ